MHHPYQENPRSKHQLTSAKICVLQFFCSRYHTILQDLNVHSFRNPAEKGLQGRNLYLAKAWFNSSQPMARSCSSELRLQELLLYLRCKEVLDQKLKKKKSVSVKLRLSHSVPFEKMIVLDLFADVNHHLNFMARCPLYMV
ncbi:uncharacterized protein LOC110868098 isoform X3 [Helianthus annuus]|nr:uncharacterized protein LOC110868098 isoform X3 [Helianthus annuus]